MKVCFDGIGQLLATFLDDGTAAEGQVCGVTAGATVGGCQAGDRFCGVVCHAAGGTAAVQLKGYVTVSYTGTAPAVGYAALTADGAGGVCAGGSVSYLVLDVDTAAGTVGFVL